MKVVVIVFTLLAGCVLAAACSRSSQQSDVTGVYELRWPMASTKWQYGVERLVVRENGTYEQWFALKGSTISLINTGAWTVREDSSVLSAVTGEKYLLELRSPVIVDNGFGKPALPLTRRENAIWPLKIKKRVNGSTYFPCNDDLGTWFKRVGE